MKKRKQIAYYISAHGYGHATRSAVILARLLKKYKVHVKTEIPSWFFRLFFNDPFDLVREQVDVGCVQQDFININMERTLTHLQGFYKDLHNRLQREVHWLKGNNIDLVISDAASSPLKAGKILGIPSMVISNFTWHDIYSHLPGAENRPQLLEQIRDEYASASLQILPQCHIDNEVIRYKEEVGFIASKGRDLRHKLNETVGSNLKGKTLVFIYLGQSGADTVDWPNLRNLPDCIFLTRDPLPRDIENLWVLDDKFGYQDLIASSDIVFTKAGYSTLATAFAHGKPVISCPRRHFYEFEIVKEFLYSKQVGMVIDEELFYSCSWGDAIKKAREMTVKGKIWLDGETRVIETIDQILQSQNCA